MAVSIMRRAFLYTTFPILLALAITYLGRASIDPTLLQCAALSVALSGKVSFPNSPAYISSTSSYWSQQEESLTPSCIVSPTSASDVQTAVKTLTALSKTRVLGCKFAIRGGGHTPWAGSANIDGGVTIDLRALNKISVNAEGNVTSVGGGAVWGDVYRAMDAKGLTVVGGRGSSIGVGGLLTGGASSVRLLSQSPKPQPPAI